MSTASTPRTPAPVRPEIPATPATPILHAPTGPTVSRRAVLVGGGAGLVVLAAGGTLWRALDQGVFATGTGPAYDAWSDEAGARGGGSMTLVRAAILAANAHDSQPWLFRVTPTRIDVYADPRRNLGSIDPLLREMHLSLGCALENLMLAAAPHGYVPVLTLLPTPPTPRDPTHVATVTLRRGAAPVSPLYAAIPQRHTNRGAYDTTRPLSAAIRARLQALNTVADIGIVWYTSTAAKRAFSALTVRATEGFIADPQQSIDDFAWWRGDWHDLQRTKDGITIDAAGLSPLTRVLGKMLLPQSRASNDQAWLTSTRDPQMRTAAAFGIIVARDARSTRQRLDAGRLWQRMQLWATTQGLAMQPLNQTVERAEREQTAGLTREIAGGLQGLMPEGGWHPLMPFRIGYPTTEGLKSPRRPVMDVITQV